MTSNTSRPNLTGIAAACILSGGLITAAIIDSHKTVAVAPAAIPGFAPVAAMTPPIGQNAVRAQFEAQVDAQTFKPLTGTGGDYTFKNVTVSRSIYSAKDDDFTIEYGSQWENVHGEKMYYIDSASLRNDGYGHYFGAPTVNEHFCLYFRDLNGSNQVDKNYAPDAETQCATVTLK